MHSFYSDFSLTFPLLHLTPPFLMAPPSRSSDVCLLGYTLLFHVGPGPHTIFILFQTKLVYLATFKELSKPLSFLWY